MSVQLLSFPWQATPARKAVSEAFDLLLKHLHPGSKYSGLTPLQQYDVFSAEGGFGWADVMNADDTTTIRLAERVQMVLGG